MWKLEGIMKRMREKKDRGEKKGAREKKKRDREREREKERE